MEHFWEFIGLPPGGGGFEQWVKREPSLTFIGLGDDFSPEMGSVLRAASVSAAEFRQALSCTTEVLYSTMYGAADEEGSRRYLSELASIAEAAGADWPKMDCFAASKWSDGHGWGRCPSERELAEWKGAGSG